MSGLRHCATFALLCMLPVGVGRPVALALLRGKDEAPRTVHLVRLPPLAEVERRAHLGVRMRKVTIGSETEFVEKFG